MGTRKYFKNNEEDLDHIFCSTRSLKKATRENDYALDQTKYASKLPPEKALIINFPGFQRAISMYRFNDVDREEVKKRRTSSLVNMIFFRGGVNLLETLRATTLAKMTILTPF